MFVTPEMKQRVNDQLATSTKLAKDIYGFAMDDFKTPIVVYKKRGRTAGTANYGTWELDFNSVLLMENDQNFIDRTVVHELAHLIDHHVNPEVHNVGYGQKRSAHGPSWKRVMRLLGAEPTRCHSYDTTNSAVKKRGQQKFVYRCSCGGTMELGPTRHRKMQSGVSSYWKHGHSSHTYTYEGTTRPSPVQTVRFVAPTTTPLPAYAQDAGNGLTKAERSLMIVGTMTAEGYGRQDIIHNLMSTLDMSKAGASTYHYNAKKKLGL